MNHLKVRNPGAAIATKAISEFDLMKMSPLVAQGLTKDEREMVMAICLQVGIEPLLMVGYTRNNMGDLVISYVELPAGTVLVDESHLDHLEALKKPLEIMLNSFDVFKGPAVEGSHRYDAENALRMAKHSSRLSR